MKRYRYVLGILGLALAVSAVLVVQGIKAADDEQARVRLAHAVPGGPEVDVLVDDVEIYHGVSYSTVTTYTTLAAGLHTVVVRTTLPPIPLIEETVILTGGMDFTVAGMGTIATLDATFLVDDNTPLNSDTVRLVHLSPDAGVVDIAISGTLTSTVVSNVPFGAASDYIAGLGAGDTSFEVRPAGEIIPVLEFSRTLESGTVNTVFIMGLSNPPGSFLYPLQAVHTVDQRFFRIYLPLMVRESEGP
jgi:hypothetical protein